MLANFQMCGIMLLLGTVLNRLVGNASPGGPMHIRCLIFICQEPVSRYFCFSLLPLGPELW